MGEVPRGRPGTFGRRELRQLSAVRPGIGERGPLAAVTLTAVACAPLAAR